MLIIHKKFNPFYKSGNKHFSLRAIMIKLLAETGLVDT